MNSANCALQLADTEMEVLNTSRGRYWSKFHAIVTMRLSPVPRVFIDATFDIPSSLLDYGATVSLRLHDGPEIEAHVVKCHFGPEFRSRLVPNTQPVTAFQSGERLRRVDFKVINYPSLFDPTRPALLQSGPWLVKLAPMPDLQAAT